MLPNKKEINYCPMKYHNFLSEKFDILFYYYFRANENPF